MLKLADVSLVFFSVFPQTGFDIQVNGLSETIHINCQAAFLGDQSIEVSRGNCCMIVLPYKANTIC